jgi:hypothetical protein
MVKSLNYLIGVFMILLILLLALHGFREAISSYTPSSAMNGYVVEYRDGSRICIFYDDQSNATEVVMECLRR